jgi:hypothetical protein
MTYLPLATLFEDEESLRLSQNDGLRICARVVMQCDLPSLTGEFERRQVWKLLTSRVRQAAFR